MKNWNEMTLKEKVEYDRKDLLNIEASTNANINLLTEDIKNFRRLVNKHVKRFDKIHNNTVKYCEDKFGYYADKVSRIDNDVFDLDEKNNYEHSVMTKLIIGSFAMHILILIYLIIKGV